MPDRLDLSLSEDRADQLNWAIDRMLDSGPAPVLDDPDLQELLLLAHRLDEELPRDLPDPAFRARLKVDLTDELPAIVPIHNSLRRITPGRVSYAAALAGIAAMLLAVVGVGSLAFWSRNDTPDPDGRRARDAAFTATSPFTASALGFATATVPAIGGGGEILVIPATEQAIDAPAVDDPTVVATDVGDTPAETPTPSDIEPTAMIDPTESPAPESTTLLVDGGLAVIPSVDGSTVEDGPVPLAIGGSDGPESGVSFVLDAEMPDFDRESTVYVLSPPDVDPVALVEEIGATLEIDGSVQVNEATGKPEYHVDGSDGSTFRWYPASGEFSYSRGSTSDDAASDITPDEATLAARDWLATLGYPVERLKGELVAQRIDESQWLVETWVDAMPQPGVGHQLGARIFVGGDGSVLSATGYWLNVTGVMAVPLLTAEEAWVAAQVGEGYWTGGGAADGGGELRCGAMTLAYVLTEANDGQLFLQPVVRIDGMLRDVVGSETPISIFVQAARTSGENTP